MLGLDYALSLRSSVGDRLCVSASPPRPRGISVGSMVTIRTEVGGIGIGCAIPVTTGKPGESQ